MLFEQFLGSLFSLHGNEFISLRFKARNDISCNRTLDTIGFDLRVHRNEKARNEIYVVLETNAQW